MAVGRARRFEQWKPRVVAVFGDDPETIRLVYCVFELLELAWHDCYSEVTPPDGVLENVLLCSSGTLAGLIQAAHLAVIDSRDLSVWASDIRGRPG
jgi:hypothetical protein